MNDLPITLPAPVLRIEARRPRMTPPPAGRSFRAALEDGAGSLLEGVEAASGFVPGGAVVSAAIRGASQMAGAGAAADAAGEVGSMGEVLRESHRKTLELLSLQQSMNNDNRHFTTLSNVMKARHDTARAVIHNMA